MRLLARSSKPPSLATPSDEVSIGLPDLVEERETSNAATVHPTDGGPLWLLLTDAGLADIGVGRVKHGTRILQKQPARPRQLRSVAGGTKCRESDLGGSGARCNEWPFIATVDLEPAAGVIGWSMAAFASAVSESEQAAHGPAYD